MEKCYFLLSLSLSHFFPLIFDVVVVVADLVK